MDWQHPQWLYLILPLGAAWLGLALYSRRQRRRAAQAFVAPAMWSRILPGDSPARFWVKTLLRETALVAGLVALAGPRWGTQYEEVIPRGSDLYILIDVSRSMLAQDVPPSRLGRAKADVAALINRLQGERVGLIAFAGQAVVKCPLTVDYDAFRRTLDELDTGSAPRGGTAIGDAIRKALEVFHARAERDQAILLITDGDDQQSYPLEAAASAAERHVTLFTVGLGDADQGARVPENKTPVGKDAKSPAGSKPGAASQSFVEYQGQQVWSKLDNSLLKEIALKTSGVYVPVGIKAYDLGELYADYLQGRRGAEDEGRQRLRRGEQFQIFLALALLALLADLCVRPHVATVKSQDETDELAKQPTDRTRSRAGRAPQPVATALVLLATLAGLSRADDPAQTVREGMQLYREETFDKARDKFAAARSDFDKMDAAKAAIAAFDEACASHRNGDADHAREWYLKAGLAHDRGLAAAAHFNLGTLAAEEARRLAGEHPESVPADKRQAILDQLKGAVASFRHSLELQPGNPRARRDIELVRQWIKYYTGKWHENDRQKRRQETNLVAFLEYLSETQRALRESVKSLPATAPADAYAELKRLQDELLEEISPLKEKIKADLQPKEEPAGASAPPANSQELEQGISMLQGWADTAGEKMSSASRQLASRQSAPAAADQKSVMDELDKIWEAVVPFQALLARDLADQTQIARTLAPDVAPGEKPSAAQFRDAKSEEDGPAGAAKPEDDETEPSAPGRASRGAHQALSTESDDLAPLAESEQRTSRRTQLLKLKAEAELERLEKSPPAAAAEEPSDAPQDATTAQPKPVDPEQLKAGFQKAIDLAPQAASHMDVAAKGLQQNDRQAAYPPAEEARKILEEIQKAQPEQKQPDQKQEQKDKDKQKEEQKDKEQKKEDEQKDQQQKDQEEKKPEEQKKPDENKPGEKKPMSKDQIEAALRKVRERQQEKRERDRKMKARVSGRVPVEKDW